MKIHIFEDATTGGINIWIQREDGLSRTFSIAEPVELNFVSRQKEKDEGDTIKPTLKIGFDGRDFLLAMLDAINKFGIHEKVDTSARLAELKATSYHLEDMRKLVFSENPKKAEEK